MTIALRDHFAGLAMQGIMTRSDSHRVEFVAARSYQVADAMLAARGMAAANLAPELTPPAERERPWPDPKWLGRDMLEKPWEFERGMSVGRVDDVKEGP